MRVLVLQTRRLGSTSDQVHKLSRLIPSTLHRTSKTEESSETCHVYHLLVYLQEAEQQLGAHTSGGAKIKQIHQTSKVRLKRWLKEKMNSKGQSQEATIEGQAAAQRASLPRCHDLLC